MKVPKKVRKAGNKALALADNPAAMELAAAALTAAAAALRAQGRKHGSDAAPQAAAQQQGTGATSDAPASRLGDLVKAAALEGALRLLDSVASPAQPASAAGAKPAKPKRGKPNGGAGGNAARDE
jgi:hypothetical protein